MKTSLALILIALTTFSAWAQLNRIEPTVTLGSTNATAHQPSSEARPPERSLAVPQMNYQLDHTGLTASPGLPLTNSLLQLPRGPFSLPQPAGSQSATFDLNQETSSLDQGDAPAYFEEQPSGFLSKETFATISYHNSVRLSEREQTSLVEYLGYLVKPTRKVPSAAWTDQPDRFPRPPRLVREPGLHLLSIRF